MNELERKAVQRVVDQAESLGLGDKVPRAIREMLVSREATNGGAIMWWSLNKDLPDIDWPVGCCIGNDLDGPEFCNCWEPEFDMVQQQPGAEQLIDSPLKANSQVGLCHDCAYRKNSPERAIGGPFEDVLLEMPTARDSVFMCHQGVKRPVKWVHPDGREVPGSPDDYQPLYVKGIPYQAGGDPALICGGYHARRNKFLRDAAEYPYWLEELAGMQEGGEILPGGMLWEDLPPANRGGGALTRGKNPLRSRWKRLGSQRAPHIPEVPTMPAGVRIQVLQVLRDHPGRWARVYDGGRSGSTAVATWFRRAGHDRWVDAAMHRDGLTIAVYARAFSNAQDFVSARPAAAEVPGD